MQIFINSKIAAYKFFNINKALRFLAIGKFHLMVITGSYMILTS